MDNSFPVKLCSVPFCHSTCSGIDHHPLVKILCEFPCNGSIPYQNVQSKLEDAITDAQANGWGMSDDVPDKGASSPNLPLMHWAAVLGKARALKRLVEEGFSTKSISNGITALSLAMRHMLVSYAKCNEISQAAAGFKSLAEVLFKFDKNVEDQQGRIALNLACEQYVTALTQPGAECTFRKSVLQTLLSLVDVSSPDAVALINHADCERMTCLHVLAQRDECIEFVDAFLEKGADPTMRNRQGKTPCEVAQSLGQHQMARHLFRATPMSATSVKRPGSPELVSRDVGSALHALPPVHTSTAPVLSDVSQQVREQVKNHVANRHTQGAPTPVIQITDNVRVNRSSYQAQMKGNVRELRDVCSVDFAVMNQQSVPAELSSRHAVATTGHHALPNGVPAGQTGAKPLPFASATGITDATGTTSSNGDFRNEPAGGFTSYGQLTVAHRQEINSPPPLLPGAVCNGSSASVLAAMATHHSTMPITLDENVMSDSSSPSEDSGDEQDTMLEDELLLTEDDSFVIAMKQVKSSLGPDALSSLVGAEAERRQVDYDAAMNQVREAKHAHTQLLFQARATRKHHESIVSQIEDIKARIIFVNKELEQRNRRCADLDHERQAIDSQYKLSQLQHMACSQALEAIPLAYQMNIAFDDDASHSGLYQDPPPPSSSATHADVSTPFFDNASVSSTPVHQGVAFV